MLHVGRLISIYNAAVADDLPMQGDISSHGLGLVISEYSNCSTWTGENLSLQWCHNGHDGVSNHNPNDIWERACAVLHSRGTAHSICNPSRIIATVDSSMLWLFREAIMSPLIVFTSSPTCFAGTNSIGIDLITMKDRFFLSIGPRASATSDNPPFLLVVNQVIRLHNDFSIPRAPENMSHDNIYIAINFYIWTSYKPGIAIIKACRGISIKYKSMGGSTTCSWYIVT